IFQRDRMCRENPRQGVRIAGMQLLDERLRFLALILEARVRWELANITSDGFPAHGVGAGHTTSFRLDPCPPPGSEKRLSCRNLLTNVGWAHPFPRTGGAPSGACRKYSTAPCPCRQSPVAQG